jgi:two-component system cell cycle sensor histidine kinase/response regulator CckA
MVTRGGLSPRVLIVEDDAITRLAMVGFLTEAGFDVLDTASGGEAIRLMINPDDLDLLITDVNRPWPDGIVVARHAKAHYPPIPILFVTGAAERLRLENVPGPFRFLPKPFSRAALEAAAHAMIHDPIDS